MGSHRDTPAALCCGCILSAFAVPSCSAVTKASLNGGDGEWCSKLGDEPTFYSKRSLSRASTYRYPMSDLKPGRSHGTL